VSGHQEEVGHLSEEMHIRQRENSLLTVSPERKRTQSQTGMSDLFAEVAPAVETEKLADGAFLFRRFAGESTASIVRLVSQIAEVSPFRHMITPGGKRMSVAMTNCGSAGWTTDRQGYRYAKIDPETGAPWPPMPSTFQQLAERAAERAGFGSFEPDSCLINRYEPGTKLSLHQDRDEKSYEFPIVSVSLGLPAKFLFGGLVRTERPRRFRLENGDVVVWGGPSRLAFHGVDTLADGEHPLTGRFRLNLTFRRASDW
jgi:alkylated DNA repair protein (DNA oxidative demethylase)